MNSSLENSQLNSILLKPRFKIETVNSKKELIKKFEEQFAAKNNRFIGKIIDHHVVIDVPQSDAHFWSPQLHLELEEVTQNGSLIKGLFGPKPTVWTFFIFLHFGVAITFIAFLIGAYTRWNLKQDYKFATVMCIVMLIAWLLLYVLGRLGRKKGRKQMEEMRNYLTQILE